MVTQQQKIFIIKSIFRQISEPLFSVVTIFQKFWVFTPISKNLQKNAVLLKKLATSWSSNTKLLSTPVVHTNTERS